ncbi:Ig-like domain-containing protein [Loktanella sp. F6476L]|uniref:Ig-like domain-containing protein n=1 Tax=Loktanella sp. F6476L TaxID=2926405 RepID=UPI001FF28001|nr:Ig-like domain-containing protein [Loktanella sp. F6476L]MCK0122749.1 Ig-like domain-containing protein [Loktanella sp. F6476L]
MTKTIDFNDLSGGTIVDNEYQSAGVTIQAWTAGGVGNRAMIFDTSNPTGGDYDLATSNLGNALIVSEDGDSHDPDDAIGGTFRFRFADGADLKSLTFLDNEEGATVRFYNEHGQLIATRQIPTTGDNGQYIATFDVEGVYTMDVQLHGSGAVDNLVYDDIGPDLDGTVEGTAGDDVIDVNYDGDPDGDRVDNNDAILAGDVGDDDLIVAGAGDDLVKAGNGDDLVFGGTGRDTLMGEDGDDTLCGQDGDDVLFGGNGDDILEGMNNNDLLYGDAGNDDLYGDAGTDTLFGGSGDDLLKGGSGNDILVGDGADTAGTTEFLIDWDQLGSDGNQTLTVDGQSVNVSVGTPQSAGGKEWFVENGMLKAWDVTEPTTADMHFDTEVSNVSFTLLDVDALDKITIMAKDAQGNLVEVQFEDTGVHTVNGNMIIGSQTNAAGPGADNNGQDVEVTIAGPIQHLWIVLDDGPERDYSGTVAVTDITFEIPAIADGVDGNDVLMGGAGDDVLLGNGGNDNLDGGIGNDTLEGGDGDDRLFGNDGDDTQFGGAGNDVLGGADRGNDVFYGGDGDDMVEASYGNDTIYGDAGNDNLWASADNDLVYGGTGDDSVYGGHGQDTVYGDAGNDTLSGGSNDDTVYGGSGNDVIEGDALYKDDTGAAGNDELYGGAGDDTINGGAGDDLICGDDEDGATGRVDQLTLQWTEALPAGTALGATQTVAVDGMNVTIGFAQEDEGATADVENTAMYVEAGEAFDPNSGLHLHGLGGEGGVDNTSTTTLSFASNDVAYGDEVQDVSFRINDIDNGTDADDHIDIVTVRAYNAAGEEIAVTITAESGAQIINGNTVTGGVEHTDGVTPAAQAGSVLFEIAGPVARIEIDYDNGETTDQRVDVSDINFFTTASEGTSEAGNDVLNGDAGDDVIYGKGGDDVITGGAGADEIYGGDDADTIIGGAGDVVDGGAGGDDNDVLDLTGQGSFILTGPDGTGSPVPDSNGNGLDGQVVFVDADGNPTGETISFTEIEEILGDEVTNFDPDALDDVVDATEDSLSDLGNVLDNDTDANAGDTLTVGAVNGDETLVGTPVEGSDGGLVTINPDGTASFDPNGDFEALGEGETATTTVTYTVDDGNGGTDTATVTITVTGTNDAPDATADVYTQDQDADGSPAIGNVIGDNTGAGQDSDPEGDTIRVTSVTNGTDSADITDPFGAFGQGVTVAGDNGGLVTINNGGNIYFDANGEFDALGEGDTATTTVTYTLTDENGATDTATVTITVTGTNDAPVAVADTGDATEDGVTDLGNVLGNDTDVDGDDLTVGAVNGDETLVGTPVTGDNGGLVTINADGTASFDPNGDFEALGEGETAETTVTYTVTDPSGATSTTTVTVTVTGVNDAPNAVDSAYVVSQDETFGDVDANAITDDTGAGADSDPEGDDLTVVRVDNQTGNVGNAVAGDNGGLFTVNADGSVDFDANGEFDDLGAGEEATTTITYTIADENGLEDTASVTFTVTGSNDGPVAVADDLAAGEDDPAGVVGNVLDNDSDPDGDPLTVGAVNGDETLVGTPVDGSDGGLVTINPDGTVTFDPNGDFDDLGEGEEATTTVTYTVTDPSGATSTETVTITVTGTNDAPVAVADTDSTDQDTVIDLDNVLGNDSDPEGDDLTVGAVNGDETLVGTPVAGDNGGLVTINADGTASFDPNGDFDDLGAGETADTTVTYTVTDENGATDSTTVTVTVTGTNDGPTAVADTFETNEDDVTDLGNVLDNDSDPDGDPLTVGAVNGDETLVGTPVDGSNGGLVTINPDGSISFDPNGDFDALAPGETAETTVTYTVTDPSGATSTETVTITVNGVNDGPDATDNAYVVSLTETAGDVDGNVITGDTGNGVDSDPEGDDLTVVAVDGDPANVGNVVAGDNGGTFTINADGTVDFDAGDDFDDLGLGATRDTSVTYTIVDENGATDTANVTFTVTGINDGTVQGTDGNDVINPNIPYVDADGDIVDAGDGILPGDEGTDNDVIEGFGGNDVISAGAGSDDVFGGDGNDTINGNQGDDNLFGGQGEDTINGGLGNDTINGGADDDQLNGQDGDDTIAGGAGDDIVNGGADDDELRGGSGNDIIEGSEGEDTLFGGTGDDDLWGGLDDDTVIGGAGNDTVAGEAGDDELHGGLGDDTFFGGAGNDVITDVEGSDTVDAGDGDDIINVGSTQGDEAPDVGYPEQPSATIPGLVFPGYDADEDPNDDKDFVDGGAGNDIINTGDDDDSIIGGSGNDTINAGFDDDTVDGGTGDDFIEGGEGNDVIEGGAGDDTIYGGLEDPLADAVSFPDDEPDAAGFQDLVPENNGDTIFGGDGNDTIFGQDDDDTLFGGAGNDVLDGGVDDDVLDGGDGDDVLIGGQGNDSIDGGTGEDTIDGGIGDDTIFGGADIDFIDGGDGDDTIFGGEGSDVLAGGDGDDVINGGPAGDIAFGDDIFGGAGNDTITGSDGGNGIDGGDGDDTIFAGDVVGDVIEGGAGSDLIYSGSGTDVLFGGTGSDTFYGGNGGDVVTGGEDADGQDIDVLDLTGSNVDRIDYVDGDPEAGTVTFLDGSTMTFSEIENVIPCFTPGTLIATPKGERLVEELQVGDRIITRDNGIQEIAWMGHKPMSGQQLVQNPHLQPVLIKAGALGHGLPERDMMVSPNHRVLVSSDKTQLYFEESEVLAAAKHMVGAEGIHTVNVMQTTYVHFMFERHEVVLSNGAWTESFQPGDYSLKGIGNSQRNEIFDLFPELQSKTGLENYQSARKALKKHEAKLLLK